MSAYPGNYDKSPVIAVPGVTHDACVAGWKAIAGRLRNAIAQRVAPRSVLVIECYPGVEEDEILQELRRLLLPALALRVADALRPSSEIDALVAPFLGGDDPVFGFLSSLTLPEFFDADKIAGLRSQVERVQEGLVLLVGCGAHLISKGDILVYADLAHWEATRTKVITCSTLDPARLCIWDCARESSEQHSFAIWSLPRR